MIMKLAAKVTTQKNIYHEDAFMWGIFGSKDVDYSISELDQRKARIKDMNPYGNGMWQIESDDGIQTWATAEQIDQIKSGTKTVLDVAEENQLVDKGATK